jgi:hypothetical protein
VYSVQEQRLYVSTKNGVAVIRTNYKNTKGGTAAAIPVQASTGLEGFRRLRLPDFMKAGT